MTCTPFLLAFNSSNNVIYVKKIKIIPYKNKLPNLSIGV